MKLKSINSFQKCLPQLPKASAEGEAEAWAEGEA